jgi:5-aminopentanamidase
MRVAVAGVPPAQGREAGLARAGALAAAAAGAGAALLLLPQRFAGEAAEPSDGPLAAAVRALAARAGVAVAYGYAEGCTGQEYDAVQLVDAGGRALANYRRAHLDPARDAGRFARGHWLTAMPLGARKVGLLVGHDLAFPEAARALRLAGCDLILAAGGAAPPAVVAALLAARAAENACHVAYASGDPDVPAAVLGPDGAALARGHGAVAGLAQADLGPPEPRPALLGERRPRLYRILTAEQPAEEGAPW